MHYITQNFGIITFQGYVNNKQAIWGHFLLVTKTGIDKLMFEVLYVYPEAKQPDLIQNTNQEL